MHDFLLILKLPGLRRIEGGLDNLSTIQSSCFLQLTCTLNLEELLCYVIIMIMILGERDLLLSAVEPKVTTPLGPQSRNRRVNQEDGLGRRLFTKPMVLDVDVLGALMMTCCRCRLLWAWFASKREHVEPAESR